MSILDIFRRSPPTTTQEYTQPAKALRIVDEGRRYFPIGKYTPENYLPYRNAAEIVARHISNMTPDFTNMTAKPRLKTQLLLRPNPLFTWRHFLSVISTFADIYGTAYIFPWYDYNGDIIGLWPVMGHRVEMVVYDGEVYLRTAEGETLLGRKLAAKFQNVGIITNRQLWSIYKGTDPDQLLHDCLKWQKDQDEATRRNFENTAARFVAAAQAPLINSDIQKEADRSTLQQLEDGKPLTLYSQAYGQLTQITPHPYDAKEAVVKSKAQDYLTAAGVSESIYNGTATPDEMALFFQQTLEPRAAQIEEAINNCCFTDSELQRGNHIELRTNKLLYLSERQLNVIAEAKTAGLLTVDEMREILDFAPLPNGEGRVRYIRGEYYNNDNGTQNDKSEEEVLKEV